MPVNIYPESPGSSIAISGLTAPAVSTSGDTITGTAQSNSSAATYTLELDINGTWTQEATGVSWATLTSGYKLSGVASGTYNYRLYATYLGLTGFYSTGTVTVTPSGLIFSDNFDAQPDWNSGLAVNDLDGDGYPDGIQINDPANGYNYTLPANATSGGQWYSCNQDPVWSPSSKLYPDPNGQENLVLKSSSLANGGSGKCLFVYRGSIAPNGVRSDGNLTKYLQGGHNELFVRFYFRYQPDWTVDDTADSGDTTGTKLFRIEAWNEDVSGLPSSIYHAFSAGDQQCILLYDYTYSSYGARNHLAMRAFPQKTNYMITDPAPINTPRTWQGFLDMNYQGDIRDLNGDGVNDNTITIKSLTTGNILGTDPGNVEHRDVWGDTTNGGSIWRKLEFYVKMNSAPGAMDGVVAQWLDNQLLFKNTEWPWVGNNATGTKTDANGYPVGATTITLAAASGGTGAIVTGNTIQFAGDSNTYEVANGTTQIDVSAGGIITLKTGLLKAIPAAQTAITVTGITKMPKWSLVSFGGNSFFHAYPESAKHIEWRAYDDIEIFNALPAGYSV